MVQWHKWCLFWVFVISKLPPVSFPLFSRFQGKDCTFWLWRKQKERRPQSGKLVSGSPCDEVWKNFALQLE
jgi:hypothetical protein